MSYVLDVVRIILLALALWMTMIHVRKCCIHIGGFPHTTNEMPHALVASVCWAGFWFLTR